MTLEQTLRVSIIQAELRKLAETCSGGQARVLRYAAQVLALLKM